MKLTTISVLITGAMAMLSSYAADTGPQAVIESVTQYLPGFKVRNIEPSHIPGLYRLQYGPNIFYMSADGRYVVHGEIVDISEGRNMTEIARKNARIESVASLEEEDMIVFSPEIVEATITVFTDITCPYCAKFHQEIPKLNEQGIKVRYLAYPRVGIPSPVADDMASVWCSDDPRQALTDAKAGLGVESAACSDPIKEHYNAGNRIGVEGTPTIVLEDGSLLAGYRPYFTLIHAARQANRLLADY